MKVHNVMEEIVFKVVNEICDEEAKRSPSDSCTTPECRYDVACFVLNRIPQRYVTSGRGLAHAETDYQENPQLMIDVVTLVNEGVKRVTATQRPYYKGNDPDMHTPSFTGPCFNIPTVKGRLINGINFEPISDVTLSLYYNNELVEMVDSRWNNPFNINQKVPGHFIFWPNPLQAEKEDIEGDFEFEIRADDPRYEDLRHFFHIHVISDNQPADLYRFNRNYNIGDIFLLPAE